MTEPDDMVLGRLFVRVLGVPDGGDVTETSMDNHASWDSMAHINLILAIEQEFRISFTPEEASLATSFGAILGMVAARR